MRGFDDEITVFEGIHRGLVADDGFVEGVDFFADFGREPDRLDDAGTGCGLGQGIEEEDEKEDEDDVGVHA
jgi:hypothetical protein